MIGLYFDSNGKSQDSTYCTDICKTILEISCSPPYTYLSSSLHSLRRHIGNRWLIFRSPHPDGFPCNRRSMMRVIVLRCLHSGRPHWHRGWCHIGAVARRRLMLLIVGFCGFRKRRISTRLGRILSSDLSSAVPRGRVRTVRLAPTGTS